MAACGVQSYQPCVNRFGTFSGSRTSSQRCRLARRFAAILSSYDRERCLGNRAAFFTAAHPSTGAGRGSWSWVMKERSLSRTR